jgi:hypothetical protein
MTGNDVPTSDAAAASELTLTISQTIAALFSTRNVKDTLAEVLALAVDDIEGCDLAALVVMDEDGFVSTPVRTDGALDDIGFIQSPARGGALINALASGTAFYAPDLADGSWPDMAEEAQETGIRGILMLPLAANSRPGALALFAHFPHAFGVIDRTRGLLMAYLAGVALTGTETIDDGDRLATNLQASLAIREVVSQAQGILMEREHITGDQAFDLLRRASVDLDVKMREVAQELIDSGEWPDTRIRRRPDQR